MCGARAYQLQAAGDTGKHIVEVMGDTAGQLADCFHLLALAQGAFCTLPVAGFPAQGLHKLGQCGGAVDDPRFQRFVHTQQACL